MARELKPCGTPAAYRRHLRHGEEPCVECRQAQAADVARYQGRGSGPRELRPCGTEAAYQRHIRHGVKPDFKCRVAHANYARPYYHARKQRAA